MFKLICAMGVVFTTLWACSSGAAGQESVLSEPLPSFASEGRLVEHWQKHGRNPGEFNPPLTKEQYLGRARAFFASKDSRILKKERENGDRLRFHPISNEFGVISDRNVIRTYFRPKDGKRYWERQ